VAGGAGLVDWVGLSGVSGKGDVMADLVAIRYPDEATAEPAADEAQQRVAGDDSPPEQTVGLEQA
jgi:hypothetical protein